MRKKILRPAQKLQTTTSKVLDVLSKRQPTIFKLCSLCTTLTKHETIFPIDGESLSAANDKPEHFVLGPISHVESRARIDQCPLCRVALNIVSQALATPAADGICSSLDQNITLLLKREKFRVFYHDIGMGTIALFPRTMYLAMCITWVAPFSLENPFDLFGDCRLLDRLYWNFRTRTRLRLNRTLDFKTRDYHFYSNLPSSPPSQNIDRSFLRIVVRECEKEHGALCRPRAFSDNRSEVDLLLIDIHKWRLVKKPLSGQRYLALSYVWGTVPMMKTLRSNLTSLQLEGALLRVYDRLPQVLKDAMELTLYLGECYLWCDALCIVQDDAEFKHAQIASMGLIYGQSFLTICALGSPDASVGLLGFSAPAPGGLPLDVAASSNKYSYVSYPTSPVDLEHLIPYEARAWTLQERLLSPRCLLFTATHFYFQCWLEPDLCSTNCFGKRISGKMMGHFTGGQWDPIWQYRDRHGSKKDLRFNTGAYMDLVTLYSRRKLSYAEDVMNAFSAISSRLEDNYFGAIWKGIPEPYFSNMLCWAGSKSLKRRAHSLDKRLHPSPVFPSWSWFGWEGQVTFLMLPSASGADFISCVWQFLLEDENQITELKQDIGTHYNWMTAQTPISFRPTFHPAMLHFMAYCVDSSAFGITIDGLLYHHPRRSPINLVQEYGKSPSSNNFQSEHLVSPEGDESYGRPCGMIQITVPELTPLPAVVHEGVFVLLSAFQIKSYNYELWNQNTRKLWLAGCKNCSRWGMNAILIQKRDDFWERIGIAIFTKKAWESANPKEQYIQVA